MWRRLSLHASLLYTVATKGTQDTDLGDSLHYGLAAAYPLGGAEHSHEHEHGQAHSHPAGFAWDAILELNGEWRHKQEIAGKTADNSGDTLIFLSPGIRILTNSRWAATLSLGLPIVEDLNGIQSKPEWRTIVSLAVGF
jgi:hypothetical protein